MVVLEAGLVAVCVATQPSLVDGASMLARLVQLFPMNRRTRIAACRAVQDQRTLTLLSC
jgi:hypothetical protein